MDEWSFSQIHEAASRVEFEPHISLLRWEHAAKRTLLQAKQYDIEHNYANACFFYLRFAHVVLNLFPTHPQYRPALIRPLLSQVQEANARVAQLKPSVERRWKRLHESKRNAQTKDQSLPTALQQTDVAPEKRRPSSHLDGPPGPGLDPPRRNTSLDISNTLTAQDLSFLRGSKGLLVTEGASEERPAFSYPSVVMDHPRAALKLAKPPDLPDKSAIPDSEFAPPEPLPKVSSDSANIPISAKLESGTSLRTLIVPAGLRARFLAVAQPNTQRNLETCGILCGRLNSNAFWITHLVIPKQEATSDTCSTTDEEGLFAFQDKHDLLTLGWIHTHPTQTCFMSSVDLHTHCGYQLMLDEAIAIVLAPSKAAAESYGYFRLTDPPGKQTIMRCTKSGLFHPHEQANIYTFASRPHGHAIEVGVEFSVVDLR